MSYEETLAFTPGSPRDYTMTVSRALVDDMGGDWSAPVQFRVHKYEDGSLDLIFRTLERHDSWSVP